MTSSHRLECIIQYNFYQKRQCFHFHDCAVRATFQSMYSILTNRNLKFFSRVLGSMWLDSLANKAYQEWFLTCYEKMTRPDLISWQAHICKNMTWIFTTQWQGKYNNTYLCKVFLTKIQQTKLFPSFFTVFCRMPSTDIKLCFRFVLYVR